MLGSPLLKKAPLALPAIFFLLGLTFAYAPRFSLLIPTIFFFFLYRKSLRNAFLSLMILLAGYSYGTLTSYTLPQEKEVEGTFIFSLAQIKEKRFHYKTSYQAKGTIRSLSGSYFFPVSLPMPKEIIAGNSNAYLLEGSLTQEEYGFSFKGVWKEHPSHFSLTSWRFHAKKLLSHKITELYTNRLVSQFFIAIALGELSDPLLRFAFNELGLQHILAISGFHFALFAFLFGGILRVLLPKKLSLIALIILLTGYFILLGPSPSIVRAYIGSILYILGQLLERRSSPINLLGTCLIIELLIFPASLLEIGFQLSFLATASIIWLLPTVDAILAKYLPSRTESERKSFSLPEKGVYFCSVFFRSSLSVNMAVHLAVVPTCLYLFGFIPLATFFYNLIIPPAITAVFFLFFTSIPLFFIRNFAETITTEILRLIIESPACLHGKFFFSLSEPLLFLLLLGVFSIPFFHGKVTSGGAWLSSTY